MAWYGSPTIGGISLAGDKQLSRRLMKLHPALQKKIAKDALVKASRPMIKAIKGNIGGLRVSKKRQAEFEAAGFPGSVTGNLRKSIGYRLRQYRTSGVIILVLGPRNPEGAHGHLVEYGTAPRFTADGSFRGKMPALPFMRPAWDATIGTSRQVMQSTVRLGILKEASSG